MYENFRKKLSQSQLYNGQTLYEMLHNKKRKVDTRPIILFKKELEEVIQQQLKQEGLTEEECEISDMTFSFGNAKMLELLLLRAKALKESEFEHAARCENLMTEEKNKNFDKIVRPNSFFCTFRHEIGQHTALENRNKFIFYNEPIRKIRRASEPTDLIWENKEITPKQRKR